MECLTAIGASLVEKVCSYTVVPVGRQLGYIRFYKSNVDSLKNQIQELGNKKDRLENRIQEARRNCEEIEGDVKDWLEEVERISEEAKNYLEDQSHAKAVCSCSSFPNVVSRHQLSRQAKKIVQVVESKIQKVGEFDTISFHPVLQCSIENEGYETFDSRAKTFKGIFEALKDPNVTMIGVYGMGGIGKTMLAKEVARRAKEEKLFSETIFTAVSQTPSIETIQQEIAEKLGVQRFDEIKSISVRAERLRYRLRQEKKMLIILDDVWDKLNLLDVGIYFEDDQKVGCKILLTSRSQDVLRSFSGLTTKFSIDVLSNSEATNLFNKIVNEKIALSHDFQPIAKEVVSECSGLPIAITTVAHALKEESLSTWKYALSQLKRSSPANIEGMSEKVYSSIKLSYDFLPSEEAKVLLLLCSLHQEDARIDIEKLMTISMGWGLFKDVETIEEARDGMHSLVSKLKARSLVLDNGVVNYIKMHDVIRDVCISIASNSKERRMQAITNVGKLEEQATKEVLKDSIVVSLLDQHLDQLPEKLECQQLKLFMMFNVNRNRNLFIPNNFFEETKGLSSLYLNCVRQSQSLPSSFHLLQSLQTLCLHNCKLRDVAIIGKLKALKILDLSGSEINELPKQIGQLSCLRMLNLAFCSKLEVIQPNVISSLVRLEELYIGSFTKWEVEVANKERSNASLIELQNLPQLTILHLCVLDASILPKGLFTEKLKTYEIRIGGEWYGYDDKKSRILILNLQKVNLLYDHGIEMLMKRSEVIHLEGLFEGVNNIVPELHKDGAPQIKNFRLINNAEIQYIVDTTRQIHQCRNFQNLERIGLFGLANLEKICHGKLTTDSFGKLKYTNVANCDRLNNIFPLSISKQLESIEVWNCKIMEVIFTQDKEDGAYNINNEAIYNIEFRQLCQLYLSSLPKLVEFVQFESKETTCQSLVLDSLVPLFSEKIVFPRLEFLSLSGMNFEKLWSDKPPTTSYMQNLTRLMIDGCDGLKYLSSFAVFSCLTQLQELSISKCKAMEEVLVQKEPEEEGKLEKIALPKLRFLTLVSLPKLSRFCEGDCIECPSLSQLTIRDCAKLKTFIKSSQCEQTSIDQKTLEEKGKEDKELLFNEKIIFPSRENSEKLWPKKPPTTSYMQNLTRLTIQGCDGLKYLSSFAVFSCLTQLQNLSISKCKAMEEVLVRKEPEEGKLEKIALPKLESLKLVSLPNLSRFCEVDCIECPSLSKLTIQDCAKLKTFIKSSKGRQVSFDQKTLEEKDKEDKELLFNEKVIFPKLEELTTDWSEVIREICESQSLAIPYSNLKLLDLNCSRRNKTVISSFNFIDKFHLETFSMRGFFCMDKTSQPDERTVGLTSLRNLRLYDLPLLTNYLLEDAQKAQPCKAFQALESLGIWQCGKLKNLVSFKNVKELSVSKCQGMIKLFDLSMVKSLVQLTKMSVTRCKQMVEIIDGESESDYQKEREDIVFSHLRILVLHGLPNLKSFYPGNNVIRFPKLETLFVSYCPEMQCFSGGAVVKTQGIEGIIGESNAWPLEHVERYDNINDYFNDLQYREVEQFWDEDVNRIVSQRWEENTSIALQQLFTEMDDQNSCDEQDQKSKEDAASSSY